MRKLFLSARVQSVIALPAMAIFAAVWMPALTSQAQLNITNSSSSISVSATCDSQTAANAINADGFISVSAPNQPPGSHCAAAGRITSALSSTSVSIDVEVDIHTTVQNNFFPNGVSLSAAASAAKYVSFYVTVPQSVQVQKSGGGVYLVGSGTNFFDSFPSSFVLLPGSYTLYVLVNPSFNYSVPPGFRASGYFPIGWSFNFDTHIGLQMAPAPGPFILSLSSNATFAFGTSNALTVQAAGTAPFSYQWRREGTNLLGDELHHRLSIRESHDRRALHGGGRECLQIGNQQRRASDRGSSSSSSFHFAGAPPRKWARANHYYQLPWVTAVRAGEYQYRFAGQPMGQSWLANPRLERRVSIHRSPIENPSPSLFPPPMAMSASVLAARAGALGIATRTKSTPHPGGLRTATPYRATP